MSFGHIQEGRGRREGKRERGRKRKLSVVSFCVYLSKVTQTFTKRGLEWRPGGHRCAEETALRGGDGPRSGCSSAQLMTTSNINSLSGLGPRVTVERKVSHSFHFYRENVEGCVHWVASMATLLVNPTQTVQGVSGVSALVCT